MLAVILSVISTKVYAQDYRQGMDLDSYKTPVMMRPISTQSPSSQDPFIENISRKLEPSR
jgi:hypothetical protein